MFPLGRRVHLLKSASFKMLFEKIIRMMIRLFPRRMNDTFKNHLKHDSKNNGKYHPKGVQRHRKENQMSPKGAARGAQCAVGTALKLAWFLLFSLTRPKGSPQPSQARPRLPKACQKYPKWLTNYQKTVPDLTYTTHVHTL